MKATSKNFPTIHRPTLRAFLKSHPGAHRLQYRIQGWIEDYCSEKWPDADRWYVVNQCMEKLQSWLPRFSEYILVSGDKELWASLVTAIVDDAARDDLGIRHKPMSFAKFRKDRYTEVNKSLIENSTAE